MFSVIKSLLNREEVDYDRLNQDDYIILDVRTVYEFQVGHIEGSKNIPLNTLSQHMEEIKDLNKIVVAVCRSGVRSGSAASMLTDFGIESYNGGGWQSFNDIIIKARSPKANK